MTDNRTENPSSASQPNTAEESNSKTVLPTSSNNNSNNNSKARAVDTTSEKATSEKPAEPQMKKVDISIAGVHYPVNCPIHEEEELRAAVYYINNFALDIKKEAPSIPQENLLVLSCLNLYEKIQAHSKSAHNRQEKDKQTEALVSKIMKEAQSIL